jgi:hypothetical protein
MDCAAGGGGRAGAPAMVTSEERSTGMPQHSGGQQHGQQTGMSTGAGSGGQADFPVDNLTYDLISVLHEKLEGQEVYNTYMKDAQSDPQCQQLFQQLKQQDAQMIQQLMQQLHGRLSTFMSGGRVQ